MVVYIWRKIHLYSKRRNARQTKEKEKGQATGNLDGIQDLVPEVLKAQLHPRPSKDKLFCKNPQYTFNKVPF